MQKQPERTETNRRPSWKIRKENKKKKLIKNNKKKTENETTVAVHCSVYKSGRFFLSHGRKCLSTGNLFLTSENKPVTGHWASKLKI